MKYDEACILVVDDDRDLLDSYKFALGAAGFDYSLASNGTEAIGHVTGRRHHVALVDLRIKDEDGIDLVGRLKEIDPLLECIVITAYPSHETAVRALKLGASDYLSKTADSETILETIEECLDQRELRSVEVAAEERSTGTISVAVVCDNTILKTGIAEMARKSKLLAISHFYHNFPLFIRQHPSPPSDIALFCGTCNFINFQDGVDAIGQTRLSFPETKIVIFNQKMSTENQVALLKLGISGFLETDSTEERTEEFLTAVHKGEIIAPPSAMMRALRELSDAYGNEEAITRRSAPKLKVNLTKREKEIVKCIARGLKNRDIADRLFISEKTVKTHINNIFRKLEVENRLQAINVVYEKNLLL